MGVYHFMGLGRGVGAVTCAVDYIEKALDQLASPAHTDAAARLFGGSGGINHEEDSRGKIEAIVLVTSQEVIDGKIKAFPYKGCKEPGDVRSEVEKVLRSVWRRVDPDEGRKVFWCSVNIDDFNDCFHKVVRAAYRFSPPGKQGKEIWCNLTGGSNNIGYSLLSMARLTGLSNKHYALSQSRDYQQEIQVPSAISIAPNLDGYFHVIPFLRTQLDNIAISEILLELDQHKKPIHSSELFGRLKSQGFFANLDLQHFTRAYMLKLYGLGYTTFDEARGLCGISEEGKRFLEEELHQLDHLLQVDEWLTQGDDLVEASRAWTWLTQTTL